MCCGRFRRSACSGAPAACRRIRRRRACRCAASGRAASAARSCCSTACRSTIRSAAGCTGRACRSRASIASRSSTDRARACTATTRWAASSTSSGSRAGAADGRDRSRSTATATARSSISSPATCGASSASSVEGSVFDTDGFPIVVDERARASIDNNATVEFTNVNVKLDYSPTERVNAFFRGGYFTREPRQRQGSTIDGTESRTTRAGSRPAAACAFGCPTQSDLQATRLHRLRDVPQQLPRGAARSTRRRAASAG